MSRTIGNRAREPGMILWRTGEVGRKPTQQRIRTKSSWKIPKFIYLKRIIKERMGKEKQVTENTKERNQGLESRQQSEHGMKGSLCKIV